MTAASIFNSMLIGILSMIAVGAVNADDEALPYSIEISELRTSGGTNPMSIIRGRASGHDLTDLSVVIYARTDQWYVQPSTAKPVTALRKDDTFKARIHSGLEYAALLVDASVYSPPATTNELPAPGDGILAIDTKLDLQ